MKFSRSCGYALSGLVILACQEGERFFSVDQLAESQGLPAQLLGKMLKELAKKDILRSQRGSTGGYRLTRPAKDITLLEIVEAVDGPFRHQAPRLEAEGSRQLDKRLEAVIDAAADQVREQLRAVTLADLRRGRK
jgi:Rrf2 family protein